MVKPICTTHSSASQTEYASDINTNSCSSNSSSSSSSSKYKGVRKRKWGKWVSEIRLPNSRERIWLGSYDSPEKAARAFDAALYCLRGRDAKFNFPENPPEIAGGTSLSPPEIQVVAARFAKGVELETPGNNNNIVGTKDYTSFSSGGGATTQVESRHHEEDMMDWSFLSMLDNNNTNDGGMSDYGFYSNLGHLPGGDDDQLYPPPIDDDENGDNAFSPSSFLWNF
ncbi:hypothetical protein J1N35_034988 [Gossypium stocksii]|uniref:AP2/ERF domain-containing protein n=1 Tax=Gossypium stocksii TaxID=47602 RepID=A0A9D3UT67_9ROSI|nr:hypothetical protein J1N35_034988 [Gossypium stocksii]